MRVRRGSGYLMNGEVNLQGFKMTSPQDSIRHFSEQMEESKNQQEKLLRQADGVLSPTTRSELVVGDMVLGLGCSQLGKGSLTLQL